MEQAQYIKRKLSLPGVSPLNFPPLPPLSSYEIIIIVSSLSLLLAIFSGMSLPIHLSIGVLLPFLLLRKEAAFLGSYWMWFSVLLLFRSIVPTLSALDVSISIFRRSC